MSSLRTATLRGASGLALFAAFAACNATGDANHAAQADDAGTSGSDVADAARTDGSADGDGGDRDAGEVNPTSGPPPSILPVSYQRADVGTPVSAAELQLATDELIALLADTRYFDFVDERVHGWPRTSPDDGSYWWGTFWTGVSVSKAGGTVTYTHSADGADNAGIHTSPYLESACWAHLLWGEAKTGDLVRRIARGLSAWVLAMERTTGDTSPRLLSRSFYPPPVTSNEGGRSLVIDTSASRPGVDAEPSDYIHHPNNPTLGDIYVKNKRSKDDVGHMLRAIAQVQACAPRLDAGGKADLAQLVSLYDAWAKDVDARGFVIPTRDAAGAVYEPSLQLARYTTVGNVECIGTLAIRLTHTNVPGNVDCQSGMSTLEATTWPFLKNDARQIMRTHHAAAVVQAHRKLVTTTGATLLQGLGERVSKDFDLATNPPSGFNPMDAAAFFAFAANVGVPLRSNEVRFLHARLHEAYVGMRAPEHAKTFRLFDPTTPDGSYSFDPPNIGLFHRDLGLLLGTCASPWRNPAARPLLDCDRLLKAFTQ
jgi:hypothetical protein